VIENLNNLIKQTDKKKLFVGIGNVLKSDDGIGVYIGNNIKETPSVQKLNVEISIENYIGKINSLHPDVLILVDCVDFGKQAGYTELLPVEKVKDFTFNTHNISLKKISELFKMPVFILGIQPKKIDFGEEISEIVLKSAHKILNIINQ
jgi:hydrogenase 3 maturation protease